MALPLYIYIYMALPLYICIYMALPLYSCIYMTLSLYIYIYMALPLYISWQFYHFTSHLLLIICEKITLSNDHPTVVPFGLFLSDVM